MIAAPSDTIHFPFLIFFITLPLFDFYKTIYYYHFIFIHNNYTPFHSLLSTRFYEHISSFSVFFGFFYYFFVIFIKNIIFLPAPPLRP